jgi:site-specific DNA-methyltransferase (adenine-specific)
LAEARDLLTVLEFRNKAAAVEHYLKQRNDSEDAAFDAKELRLRAERRLGELLAETVSHNGGGIGSNQHQQRSHDVTVAGRLPDGVSKMQSSRWQLIARLPEQDFEDHLAARREANQEITTRGVLRVARDHVRATTRRQRAATGARLAADAEQQVLEGDFREILAALSGVDAIITDPPYPKEFLPLYGTLAELAARCLSPHGVLAVLCGQSYLPDILDLMRPHITYRWQMAYLTPGGQAVQVWDRKFNTFWKPVLVFGAASAWAGDVVKSDVNDNDKRFHDWGQSESGIAGLVRRLTSPGQLVCDPFMGAGTTGVAAVAQGRRFVGCDIDPEQVNIARQRIHDRDRRV